jgi:hypothetical protein
MRDFVCLYNVGTVLVERKKTVYFLQQRRNTNFVISACQLLIFFNFWDGVRLSPMVLWHTVSTLDKFSV